MYLILNEKNEVCGKSLVKIGNCVEVKTIKPFATKIKLNKGQIEYEFNDKEEKEIQKEFCKQNPNEIDYVFLGGVAGSYICPLNGEETRMHNGQISVLIPCYKKYMYLMETVESCLRQTQKATEIIVLLMSEEDYKLEAQLTQKGITVYKEPQMNVSKARTYLAQKCKTDWLIFLDADDMLAPNFIEELDKEDGYAIVYPLSENLYEDGTSKIFDLIWMNNKYSLSHARHQNMTSLMHKDVFFDIGLKEEFSKGGEDFDFWLRLFSKRKWKSIFNTKTKFIYRFFSENSLYKRPEFAKSFKGVLEANKQFLIRELEARKEDIEEINSIIFLLKNLTSENFELWGETLRLRQGARNLKTILEDLIFNKYVVGLKKSRQKITKNIYKEEDYTKIGNFEINQFFLKETSFDVLFVGCNNTDNMSLFITEEKTMLIHKKVLEDLKEKKLSCLDEIFYLLENYNCYEYDNYNTRGKEYVDYDDRVLGIETDEEIKKVAKTFVEAKFFNPFITKVPKKIITFKLHGYCNKHCEYCSLGNEHKNVLSDEEVYNNFDRALTKFEKIYKGKRIFPQIMGGEPTLFSQKLTEKIIERVKDYHDVLLFTNMANPESLFFKAQNFIFSYHVTDWKSKKLKKEDAGFFYSIVVTKKDILNLKEFVDDNSNIRVEYAPCKSDNSEFNCDLEDLKKIDEITYHSNPNIRKFLREVESSSPETKRKVCRAQGGIINVDCETMKVGCCCGERMNHDIEEFTETKIPRTSEENCNKCFNIYN